MNKSSMVYRLLKIIYLLQTGSSPSAQEIADTLEVSQRTVFRDLNQLMLAGIPVYYDTSKNCYSLLKTRFLQPVDLTTEEALALMTLGEGVRLAPFQEAAHSALLKIRNVMPAGLRDSLAGIAPRIAACAQGKGNTPDRAFYRLLCDAIRKNTVVAGRYYSLKDKKEINVRIRPYTLFFSRHSWYLIGYSEKHRTERTFKLLRFNLLKETEESFTFPKGFSIDKVLGNAWGIIKGKEDHRVVIRFRSEAAPYVRETLWHSTQIVRDLPDGGCELEFQVSGLEEIRWWILGWGEMAEVVEPSELRNEIAGAIEKMSTKYIGTNERGN